MKTTLLIQDLHIPWQHPDALAFCLAVYKQYGCQQAISVGDELDWHSISYHDHDPDMPSPGDELKMAKREVRKWQQAFPDLRLVQSNHGDLMRRKMLTAGLPHEAMRDYSEIYDCKGWTWYPEIIEDMHGIPLIVRHDFGGNLKSALSKVGDACIAWGHRHTLFGVHYRANLRYSQWSMCAGCLIDPSHQAFNYAKGTLDRPMLGCGVVRDGMAYPVPMWIKDNGRWIGKLS